MVRGRGGATSGPPALFFGNGGVEESKPVRAGYASRATKKRRSIIRNSILHTGLPCGVESAFRPWHMLCEKPFGRILSSGGNKFPGNSFLGSKATQ